MEVNFGMQAERFRSIVEYLKWQQTTFPTYQVFQRGVINDVLLQRQLDRFCLVFYRNESKQNRCQPANITGGFTGHQSKHGCFHYSTSNNCAINIYAAETSLSPV